MKGTSNLFCLPFAGGNKYSYQKFLQIPSGLNIIPLDYPGRGTRARLPLLFRVDDLVEDLYQQIIIDIRRTRFDYAIFGHSMGALMAYLLAKKLVANGDHLPTNLFLSGAAAPSATCRKNVRRHLLPTQAFKDELKKFGGFHDELLVNEEMFNYIEPILRADFRACETYSHVEYPPLDIPFTVITGTEEEFKPPDIQTWQLESRVEVDFRQIPGNHFFILKSPRSILDIIEEKLLIHSNEYSAGAF